MPYMKHLFLLLLILPAITKAQRRDYYAAGDSCLKLKDYACAVANFQKQLDGDPESNGTAFMLAKSWAMAGDKDQTFKALDLYVKNNALNNNPFFSAQLIKDKTFDFIKDDARWKNMIASVQKSRYKNTVPNISDVVRVQF